MSQQQHTYPSAYQPGSHWAVTEAWAILDSVKPGVLDADVRNFLAGQIIFALIQTACRGAAKPAEQLAVQKSASTTLADCT